MRHGRARTMSLGPYPVLSLAEARKKLLQNRLLLSEGYDPLEERQKDQCKKGYAKGIRFSDVAKECIETRKSSWTNKKHAFDWYSSLKRMAFPILDKKPLAAIDEDDITALLTPLWQTKRETEKNFRDELKSSLPLPSLKNSITTPTLPSGKTISPFILGGYATHIESTICALLITIWFPLFLRISKRWRVW